MDAARMIFLGSQALWAFQAGGMIDETFTVEDFAHANNEFPAAIQELFDALEAEGFIERLPYGDGLHYWVRPLTMELDCDIADIVKKYDPRLGEDLARERRMRS